MKDKLKKIVGCLVTLALIGGGLHVLNYIVRPLEADKAYDQTDTYHRLPENTVEVVVYGSSHAYRSIQPMRMYQNYGIGAYNYGMSTQRINTTTLFVKDSLLTQKPKVAIVETYYVNRARYDTDLTLDIFYTRYLNVKKATLKYLDQCFGEPLERYLSYFMPLCAFHDDWNSLTEENFKPRKNSNAYLLTMGYKPSTHIQEITLYDPPKSEKALNDITVESLDEIVADLTDSGAEILFITTPFSKKKGYSYGDAMEQYAREHGCAYLNLFDYVDEIGLDVTTDFCDRGHLNDSGSAKVSDFLAEYILSHYQLTDMRTVPGNLWERIAQGEVDSVDDI